MGKYSKYKMSKQQIYLLITDYIPSSICVHTV